MPLPSFSEITLPLLKLLKDGKEHSVDELEENLASFFQITEEERNEIKPSGGEKLFLHKIRWARTHLKYAELVIDPRRSYVQITQRGLDLLSENPPDLTESYLTRYHEYVERRRRGDTDDVWKLSELKTFLETEMVMQFNYQPVVILSLLKCPNYTASKNLLIEQLWKYNNFSKKDYSEPLKEVIRATGKTKNRNIVLDLGNDEIKLNLESLDYDSKNELLNICYDQIAKWDSKNTLSQNGNKEKIEDDARFFLLLPNEKGSLELLINQYKASGWVEHKDPKKWGEIKKGDILLVYFAAKSVIHPQILSSVYRVLSISENHKLANFEQVKELSGISLQKIKELRDSGKINKDFNSIGYPLNLTEISQNSYSEILSVDNRLKISIDDSTFSSANSIVKNTMLKNESQQFSDLVSFLKDEKGEGYKGKILEKADAVLKAQTNIVEKLQIACSQKIVGNHLFRFSGGEKESQAKILYNISKESNETQQEFEKKLTDFFESKTEMEFANHWDSLVYTMKSIKSKDTSPEFLFLSYLAFLQNPTTHIPFTSTNADALFQFFKLNFEKISNNKDGKTWHNYSALLELANELKLKLADHPQLTLIDIQGYMWILANAIKKGNKPTGADLIKDEQKLDTMDLKSYERALEWKPNLILYGPPGTGKTFKANKIALNQIENNTGLVFQNQEIENMSDKEYLEFVINSLKIESEINGYGIEERENKNFVLKRGTHKVHIRLTESASNTEDPISCYCGIADKVIAFLKEVSEDNRYIITINHSQKNFVVLPYSIQQKHAKFAGGDTWDPTGVTAHSYHINIEKDSVVLSGTQYDCTEYMRNTQKIFGNNSIFKVTFHPSYSYEDFVEGFRPNSDEKSNSQYVLEKGIFWKACEKAKHVPPKEKVVLIIDEINRGNIPKILGELITLIEKDKRKPECSLKLTYSKDDFFVPKNLIIIGTMNTADKSLMQMDDALKRRFVFEELMPDTDLLEKELKENNVSNAEEYSKILRRINEKITGDGKNPEAMIQFRDRQIGHSYFWKLRNDDDLQKIIKYDVIPLLQDYFYGDYSKIREILGNEKDDEFLIIGEDNRTTDLVNDVSQSKKLREKLLEILK